MKINRLLLLGILSAGILAYISCRKIDRQLDEPVSTDIESKFFNSHRSSDPLEAVLIGFIKRENDKNHFVEKVIKQLGFPYWNKGISRHAKPLTHGRGASDSVNVVYVPFVRDTQNYVNALLAIRTSPTDTSFTYLCDWQYSQLTFSSSAVDTSAEGFALFFMMMDRNVFGHTDFVLTDTLLFSDRLIDSDTTLRVVHLLNTSGTAGRSNILIYEECLQFAVCGSPNSALCTGANGCDYLNCASEPDVCGILEICWEHEIGGGGSGGGGSGNPPGGGGPPPCGNGNPQRSALVSPCGPGWVPIPEPGGGGYPPPTEPIDTLLKKSAELCNLYRDSLSALCESDSSERFFNIVLYNNQYDTFRVLKSQSSEEVKPNYNMNQGRILKAEWHYHTNYPDGTSGSWPSGGDVATLFNKHNGHVMIVDTYDARYALVVENENQMNIWKNIFGNGPQKLPSRIRDSVLADSRVNSTGATYIQMTKEKLLAALGNSSLCGIGLYKASSSHGIIFTKEN